jgi:HTH-type transcriptional regulator / antitoxin HigA
MTTLLKEKKYYVIETKSQYKEYCDILEKLLWGKKNKTSEDKKNIKLLTLLIESWEEEHSSLQTGNLDPVQLLNHLIEINKIKQKDLAEKLGVGTTLISDIINYRRGMSKDVIRGLASIFKMSQEAFNRPYKLQV